MSLSKFVQEEFVKSGLNKAQFARKMSGMHPTELARVLDGSGNRLPSRNVMEKLARGLHMSVEELVAMSGQTQLLPQGSSVLMESFYPELELRSRQLQEGGNSDQKLLTPGEISQQICRIGKEIFQPDPRFEDDPGQCSQIMQTYPKSAKIFYLEEKDADHTQIRIIGSWSVVFLEETVGKAMAQNGAFPSRELALKNLSSMVMPGKYIAFIRNMSLQNRYNSYEYAPALVGSFLKQMQEYARYGIHITTLYVNVYDRDRGFYKGLGFREAEAQNSLAEDQENHVPNLYVMEHFPEDFVFPAGQETLDAIASLYSAEI